MAARGVGKERQTRYWKRQTLNVSKIPTVSQQVWIRSPAAAFVQQCRAQGCLCRAAIKLLLTMYKHSGKPGGKSVHNKNSLLHSEPKGQGSRWREKTSWQSCGLRRGRGRKAYFDPFWLAQVSNASKKTSFKSYFKVLIWFYSKTPGISLIQLLILNYTCFLPEENFWIK